MKNFNSVNEYIDSFPKEISAKLKTIRAIIYKYAPNAVESISYGMPAYKTYQKPLVYFGGFEKHIGFYATPTGHEKFKKALKPYKQGKGSVQFPLVKDLPLDLIIEMVKYRVEENIKMFDK